MENQIEELKATQFWTLSVESEKLKEERAIIHYISTADMDLGRDIVDPKGMDSTEFEKHRTVFYNHNYNLPIARNITLKTISDGVRAKTVFAKSTAFANDVYNLHAEGIINTWSIGYDIARDKRGDYEGDAIVFDDNRRITRINKWRLIEYSSAPLAMNPNALDQAKTLIKSAEALREITEAEEKEKIKVQIDYLKEFESIKNIIEEVKNTSQEKIDSLTNEIINLKNQLTDKTAKTMVLDKDKFIDDIVSRELSKLTGRKIKLN